MKHKKPSRAQKEVLDVLADLGTLDPAEPPLRPYKLIRKGEWGQGRMTQTIQSSTVRTLLQEEWIDSELEITSKGRASIAEENLSEIGK